MNIQTTSFKHCSVPPVQSKGFVCVLDVGTTGIKAFVFDEHLSVRAKAYQKIKKVSPKNGWVEQDPQEILRVSKQVLKRAVQDSGVKTRMIKAVGITNQREATMLWDQKTGKPVYPVIGWEDTRTRAHCVSLRKTFQDDVRKQTGLSIDPYFSASKIQWILSNVDRAKRLLENNQLLFGTLDTWLLWNLCEGRPHQTDQTNASRTLLFDIQRKTWSQELLELFAIPASILPTVVSPRSRFGVINKELLGVRIPVLAVCGDQQASTYAAMRAQPTSRQSVTKVTYGTGVFLSQVIGKTFKLQKSFFTTLVPAVGKGVSFALEAKVEGSGKGVDKVLGDVPKMLRFFSRLVKKVDGLIQQLPTKPKDIVVDGGIARDGYIVEIQQEQTKIPACLQSTYDGTALGCALLVWDQVD